MTHQLTYFRMNVYFQIVKIFSNCIHRKDNRPLAEAVKEISCHLIEFEEELKKRDTCFFSGKEPGMLDILMWPFVERAKALPILYNEPLNFEKAKFPSIVSKINIYFNINLLLTLKYKTIEFNIYICR